LPLDPAALEDEEEPAAEDDAVAALFDPDFDLFSSPPAVTASSGE
jgi:hypothetical protein